jgi:hypothetical protein
MLNLVGVEVNRNCFEIFKAFPTLDSFLKKPLAQIGCFLQFRRQWPSFRCTTDPIYFVDLREKELTSLVYIPLKSLKPLMRAFGEVPVLAIYAHDDQTSQC